MYSDDIKEKAFKLYCIHWSLRRIAKKLGVSESIIRHWKKKRRWEEKRQEVDKKTDAELTENCANWKSETIKQLIEIRDGLIERYEKARTGNVEQLTKAILGLNEQIALLKGEATGRTENEIKVIFEVVD